MKIKAKENKYSIRRSNNLEEVTRLHGDIFPHDDFYDSKNNIYWLAFEDNKPVGFCIITKLDKDVAFLSRAGLLSCARKKGLHKRMIRVRENYAKKENLKSVITYTKIYNITSSRNLQKTGYVLYIPEYEYADKDCLYWIKEF